MDGTWFATGVGASPVMESEGKIALLLNLSENDARSKSMHGAGGDKDAISGVNFVNMQKIFEVTATEGLLETLRGDTGLQPAANPSAGFGVQDHPCFRLAIFDWVECFGLQIVGVYLKGEPVIGIEEFDEQRKLGEVLMFSKEFAGVSLNDFRK
ncbi:MAG: hypothetical protein RL215_1136 [Planctomycetota bacterium]